MAQLENPAQTGSTPAKASRKAQHCYQRWHPDELALLQELYPDTSNLFLARRLRRSLAGVISMAFKLGLKKKPERLTEMGRKNIAKRWKSTRRRRVSPPQPRTSV